MKIVEKALDDICRLIVCNVFIVLYCIYYVVFYIMLIMCALLRSCFLNLIVLCIMTIKAFNSINFIQFN